MVQDSEYNIKEDISKELTPSILTTLSVAGAPKSTCHDVTYNLSVSFLALVVIRFRH